MRNSFETTSISKFAEKSKPLCLLWLQSALKKALLNTNFIIEVLSTVDSTNRYLLEKNTHNLHICLAEQQTAGRGRMGKSWVSPYGVNLYCSVAWPFQQPVSKLSSLSLCVGIAVAKTLTDYGVSSIGLKWPNDVVHQGKKIAGILIETTQLEKNIYKTVIGIGINVSLSNILDKNDPIITQPWTDVASLVAFKPDRNQIAYQLLKNLFEILPLFASKGFLAFQAAWFSKDILLNQCISLKVSEKIFRGIARGVDATGHLILEEADGKIRHFNSAEFIRLEK